MLTFKRRPILVDNNIRVEATTTGTPYQLFLKICIHAYALVCTSILLLCLVLQSRVEIHHSDVTLRRLNTLHLEIGDSEQKFRSHTPYRHTGITSGQLMNHYLTHTSVDPVGRQPNNKIDCHLRQSVRRKSRKEFSVCRVRSRGSSSSTNNSSWASLSLLMCSYQCVTVPSAILCVVDHPLFSYQTLFCVQFVKIVSPSNIIIMLRNLAKVYAGYRPPVSLRCLGTQPAVDNNFVDTEWENALPYEKIPGPGKLKMLMQFAPGGQLMKINAVA